MNDKTSTAQWIGAQSLRHGGVRHAFMTRKGGVSQGIYASLNCGLGSSDERALVLENRARAAACIDAAPDRLISPHQIHSSTVALADAAWEPGRGPRADALVSTTPGLALAISTADCTPILFADAGARVIGAAHAGWRGAHDGVLEATIEAMEAQGARRSAIHAAIGPTISLESYEVGPEFHARFIEQEAANDRFFAPGPNGRAHFDLPGYVRARLEAAGIGALEDMAICTYKDEERFFSYRRTTHRKEPDYGRQIAIIMLEP